VIALSYLYVFEPAIRTAFLKNLDVPLDKTILIVDEAHNLPETAVGIASSSLTMFAVKQAQAEAKEFKHKDIETFARTIQNEIAVIAVRIQKEARVAPESLVEFVRENGGIDNPQSFFGYLCSTGNTIRRNLLVDGKFPRSFIHSLGNFLMKWMETAEDDSFINVIAKYKSKRGADAARFEIVALDPSKITEPIFSEVYSNIVLSGILQPLEAYIQITKLPENTAKKVVSSPFPEEHVLPLVCCDVTTAMEKRTAQMYRTIINHTEEVVQNTTGNTGVFAASFQVLEGLRASRMDEKLQKPIFCEHRA
jgi:DNA excision repair protein ERCC-2